MDNSKKPVSYEELMLANTVSISALVAVLERKGILTNSEVLAEVDRIKRNLDDLAKQN